MPRILIDNAENKEKLDLKNAVDTKINKCAAGCEFEGTWMDSTRDGFEEEKPDLDPIEQIEKDNNRPDLDELREGIAKTNQQTANQGVFSSAFDSAMGGIDESAKQ